MTAREDKWSAEGGILARDIVSNCSALNLRRAARAASHVLDRYISPIGIRAAQFSVLSAIDKLGPTQMTHLADYMVTDRTTLTRNLSLLERDGLVSIAPGAGDKRVREIDLTDAGRDLLREARPLWAKGEASIQAQLGRERWETLLSLLRDVAALSVDGVNDSPEE
jgi:DNA-binding MarR family transcriptional regulator